MIFLVGRIPEHVISEVREGTDILSLVGEYVPLERRGQNHIGLCPFHSEKTPSFTVSPDKQMWYCFGCGEGGNVFSFLIKHQNLTFPEAVSQLAEKAGITIPDQEEANPEQLQKQQLRQKLFEINRQAARWFYSNLKNTPQAEKARDYLYDRGLSDKIMTFFGLGFAPEGWDGLLKHLTKLGYQEEELHQAGLVSARKENAGYFDRFRSRIMFPIIDHQGRVIAFGGRVIDNSEPKYLNSPETPIFHKGKNLYGLNWAAKNIRLKDRVVVVEGYMDVISAHQFGVANTVASLGTAFTKEQGQLLLRFSNNVSIAYDSDAAGAKATIRGLDILHGLGAKVRVCQLPEGLDPDDFLRRNGCDAFEKLVSEEALSLIEYKLANAMKQHDANTIDGKGAIVKELLPDLRRLKGAIEREEYIRLVAARLNLSYQAVYSEFDTDIKNNEKFRVKKDKIGKNRYNNTVVPEKQESVRKSLERQLLQQVLLEPQRARILQRALSFEDFQDAGVIEALGVIIKEGLEKDYDLAQLTQQLSEEGQKAVANVMVADENRWDRFEALIEKLYLFQLDNRLNELEVGFKNLEENPEAEQIQKFLLNSFVFWQENDFLHRINIKRHQPGKGG